MHHLVVMMVARSGERVHSHKRVKVPKDASEKWRALAAVKEWLAETLFVETCKYGDFTITVEVRDCFPEISD